MVKARWTMFLLAAMLSVPTTALATHMNSYVFYPTEHDDYGRSYEPDFQSTSVLGAAQGNCIVSLNLAASCVPDTALPGGNNGALLAPGCTDDAGRQPSGMCGLYTIGAGNGNTGTVVPPGTLGTPGTTGPGAPGRFTPTKASTIRFLDARIGYQNTPPAGGSTYLDYNSKMLDTGVSAALAGIDPNLGSFALLPGGTGLWAWYGNWQDKNGNGVVDHLRSAQECTGTTCPPEGGVALNNEFTWIGTCTQFNGQAAPPGQRYCNLETGTLMPVWIYPGNHHAFCGAAVTPIAAECGVSPTDYPGRVFVAYAVGSSCPSSTCIQELEDFDQDFGGDPIFGEQHSRKVDTRVAGGAAVWGMSDRTGEPLISGRHWVFGNGFGTWMWDQSLLVTTVVIAGVTKDAPVEGLETDFELSKLLFTDVDKYTTWSPTIESILLGSVKPAARSSWVTARQIAAAEDTFAALDDLSPAGTRLTWDECDPNLGVCLGTELGPTLSMTQDRVFDPGWAREPNAVGDVHPGATRGSCADAFQTHQGQCNTYAGYAAGIRGWIDVQEINAWYQNVAWRTPIGSCVLCITNGPSGLPNLPDGLRAENSFARVLDPGSHVFTGIVGGWKDKSRLHEETALDLLGTITSLSPQFREANYVTAPDGWIGDIVNTTGFDRLSGFLPETCTIAGVFGTYEYAQCHPYGDGAFSSPQSYVTDPDSGVREFYLADEAGGSASNGNWELRIAPTDGCWNVPVFVWRQFDTWTIGDTGAIEDFSNSCNAIVFDMGSGPVFASKDLLILPQGNMGEPVTTTMSGTVTVKDGGVVVVREFVRDVDQYAAWGSVA